MPENEAAQAFLSAFLSSPARARHSALDRAARANGLNVITIKRWEFAPHYKDKAVEDVIVIFQLCPAEPDVGIPRTYVEVDSLYTAEAKHWQELEEHLTEREWSALHALIADRLEI